MGKSYLGNSNLGSSGITVITEQVDVIVLLSGRGSSGRGGSTRSSGDAGREGLLLLSSQRSDVLVETEHIGVLLGVGSLAEGIEEGDISGGSRETTNRY